MQQTQDTNQSLGNYLKHMREEKNISVEQVAYATRISLKMLRALEEDDHTALPAPTFVRGYLQAYAKYARIDTQDLLLRYQHHLATAPDSKKGAIRSHYLYVRERYQEKRRLVLVIVLFATMLSVAGTYFLLKAKRERNKALAQQAEQIAKGPETAAAVTVSAETTASPAAEATPGSPEATATPENKTTETPAAETKASETKTPETKAPAQPSKPAEPQAAAPAEAKLTEPTPPQATERPKDEKRVYNLLLRAEEDVWLRFQTDQEEVRDLTLRTGKAIMLRADSVIKIFSGNLGALKATMNGAAIDPLAKEPRSKSVVLPETEASKYPLPLFPQFQTKSTGSSPSDSAPNNAEQ